MPTAILCAVPTGNLLVRAVLDGAGYPLPSQPDWRESVTVKGITFCPVAQNEIVWAVSAGKFDCGITDVREGYRQVTEEISWHTTMVPVEWWELGLEMCCAPGCSQSASKRRRVAKLKAAASAFLQRERSILVRCQLPPEPQTGGSTSTRQRPMRSGWRGHRETVPLACLGRKVVDLLNRGARRITINAVGQVQQYCLH